MKWFARFRKPRSDVPTERFTFDAGCGEGPGVRMTIEIDEGADYDANVMATVFMHTIRLWYKTGKFGKHLRDDTPGRLIGMWPFPNP